MKWRIEGKNFDYVNICEAEVRPGRKVTRLIAHVYSPGTAFVAPTEAERQQMLDTAREIVEAHNAKEAKEADEARFEAECARGEHGSNACE